ncbi:hypothetical protein HYX13_00325 [Candidatus Woesearchaeota archaeon]|nr:hypothetical protein [Candidatus Woesearchaeota archaeon]
MMQEARTLVTLEKTLGKYEVAVTICSDGDVIDFVERGNPGIILIDTLGHSKSVGEAMTDFLQKSIASGWGREGNAEEEFVYLGTTLASLRHGKKKEDSYEWHDSVSGIYCQLRQEAVYITSTGGITEPLLRKQKKDQWKQLRREAEYLSLPLNCPGKLDDEYLIGRSPMHKVILENEDILFLSSDGLLHNLAISLSKEKKFSIFSHHCLELAELAIRSQLDNFNTADAKTIRDAINDSLNQYFLPKDRGDDDVTFAVIKKILT